MQQSEFTLCSIFPHVIQTDSDNHHHQPQKELVDGFGLDALIDRASNDATAFSDSLAIELLSVRQRSCNGSVEILRILTEAKIVGMEAQVGVKLGLCRNEGPAADHGNVGEIGTNLADHFIHVGNRCAKGGSNNIW